MLARGGRNVTQRDLVRSLENNFPYGDFWFLIRVEREQFIMMLPEERSRYRSVKEDWISCQREVVIGFGFRK